MASVTLEQVSKQFPDQEAVSLFSLSVMDGEFVALVGPSGCGKTTTLRMIAGLEDMSQGTILIGGKSMENVEAKDRSVSMVFQNYALYPHMTARENMSFALKIKKIDKKTIDIKVNEAADMLDLVDLLDRKPFELSGGQQQRVALGRALVREPDVFLFDEPLSNLDAKMRHTMRQEIQALHRQINATFIYVTHDQVEAMTMADRIVVMNEGEIMQVDKPEILYTSPKNLFVAEFIGSPPINLLSVVIERRDNTLWASYPGGSMIIHDAKPLAPYVNKPDKPLILAIRPDDISMSEKKQGGLEIIVSFTEHMGSHKIVHGDLFYPKKQVSKGQSIQWMIKPELQLSSGASVFIEFNQDKILFFDPETTQNILL